MDRTVQSASMPALFRQRTKAAAKKKGRPAARQSIAMPASPGRAAMRLASKWRQWRGIREAGLFLAIHALPGMRDTPQPTTRLELQGGEEPSVYKARPRVLRLPALPATERVWAASTRTTGSHRWPA